LQVVFHPVISPDGKVDFKKLTTTTKKPCLFIDRNILISLLKLCEKGRLKNKDESQLVALLITWAEINDIPISAGLAIMEGATQIHSEEKARLELQKYQEAITAYPSMAWLRMAEGMITEVPSISYSNKLAEKLPVAFSIGCGHYYMAVAALIHLVCLYINKELSPMEKTKDLFKWMYDNTLINEYMLTYAAMLFTNQPNIKAPKGANSYSAEKIIAGCKNQAWDISYLTTWSTLYSNVVNHEYEYLFATNDVLLKRIFINQHGAGGFNGLLYDVFSTQDYNSLIDYFQCMMENRVKPDFGVDHHAYFENLIEEEEQMLRIVLRSSSV